MPAQAAAQTPPPPPPPRTPGTGRSTALLELFQDLLERLLKEHRDLHADLLLQPHQVLLAELVHLVVPLLFPTPLLATHPDLQGELLVVFTLAPEGSWDPLSVLGCNLSQDLLAEAQGASASTSIVIDGVTMQINTTPNLQVHSRELHKLFNNGTR